MRLEGGRIKPSTEVVKRLNDQISLELYSPNLYLQMSTWAATKGVEGCGADFIDRAADKRALRAGKPAAGGLFLLGRGNGAGGVRHAL